MKPHFKNKVVLVTGSGSGIGKEIAFQFCKLGATVILNGRNEEKLARTQLEFLNKGFEVDYCVADITNQHDCCWLADFVIGRYNKIDVVVANASISMNGHFEDCVPHYFKSVVDSNIYSVVMPLFSFLPHLKKTKGSFTIISSIAGIFGVPTGSAYCMGKMALSALHQSLRAELATYSIHLGIVHLGFTENDPDKKTLSPKGENVAVPKRNKLLQQPQSKVANLVIKSIISRKPKTILSFSGKAMFLLSRFAPSIITALAIRHQRKTP